MPEVAPVAPEVSESSVVGASVFTAGPSAVVPGLVSSGFSFALDNQYACAIIIRSKWIVDVMAVDEERVFGWPFTESTSVPPVLVAVVGVPSAITSMRVVMTSHNVAHFDPSRPMGGRG